MQIAVRLAFHEEGAVRLLNWLALEDARILRDNPTLPSLYDSGVVYRRETEEVWSDVVNTITAGHEDCDALAAYRAGELLARGWRVLGDGDPIEAVAAARKTRPKSIKAEVIITTRTVFGRPGLYHCIVRYWVNGKQYRDDPSARLGMRRGRIDVAVRRRWKQLGVKPALMPLEA